MNVCELMSPAKYCPIHIMVIRMSRYVSMGAFEIHFPLFEIVFINRAADLVNGTPANFPSPSATHLCSGVLTNIITE